MPILVRSLLLDNPDAAILGHRDLHKLCPCFDVGQWLKELQL